jgi:hypothetical protein
VEIPRKRKQRVEIPRKSKFCVIAVVLFAIHTGFVELLSERPYSLLALCGLCFLLLENTVQPWPILDINIAMDDARVVAQQLAYSLIVVGEPFGCALETQSHH